MVRTGRQTARLAFLAALSLAAVACSDGGSEDDTRSGGAGTTGGGPATGGSSGTGGSGTGGGVIELPCVTDGKIVLNDSMNYSFDYTMTIEAPTVKTPSAADPGLLVDWSGLTTDFFGKPVDISTEIDLVLVSVWGMTPAVLSENLNRDNLPLEDNKGAVFFYPRGYPPAGTATANKAELLEFGAFQGEPLPVAELWKAFDPVERPPAEHTYLVMAGTGVDPGANSRMLAYFTVDPASPNRTLTLTNASTTMVSKAEIAKAPQVPVPAGNPAISVDWAAMTVNALGNEFIGTQITEAAVAHYTNLTVTDLETQFLSLIDKENFADGWWEGPVDFGTTADLSVLTDPKTGAAFPGIDGTGTWLVALFCTQNCNNPAPWSITVLKACP